MTRRLTIIGYHNIEPTPSMPFASGAGVVGLRRQLEQLRRYANVVPLSAALRVLFDGGVLAAHAVAITFDDGYRDAFDVAVPLLRHYQVPATFFLTPGFISRECMAWWERVGWAFQQASRRTTMNRIGHVINLDDTKARIELQNTTLRDLKFLNSADRDKAIDELVEYLAPTGVPSYQDLFLDWDQCRALARNGFEIGSHSSTHAILARQDAAFQREDLACSRKVLEDQLDVPVDTLAYPNGERGDYSIETIEAARQAGYAYGVTTIHGRNSNETNPFELRRVIMQPELGVRGLFKAVAQLSTARWRHGTMDAVR